MQDVAGIVASALTGSLRDLASSYCLLSTLSPAERREMVASAKDRAAATKAAIAAADTMSAIVTMLTYQYAVRFIYAAADDRSRRHFVENLEPPWRMTGRGELWQWRFTSPPKHVFMEEAQERLASLEFYDCVRIVNDELLGPALPAENETLDAWMVRYKLTRDGWAWQYEAQRREERSRWFPSRRRLAEIDATEAAHTLRADAMRKALADDFERVHSASQRLATLKSDQLHQAVSLPPLLEANAAIEKGETLELVLLRAGADVARVRDALGDLR